MKKTTKIFIYLRQKFVEIPFTKEHSEYKPGDIIFVELPDIGKNAAKIIEIDTKMQSDSDDFVKEIKIIKKMSEEEIEKIKSNNEEAKKYFQIFCEKVKHYKLKMKPVSATISYEGDLFYGSFVADDRIDFRDLVKDLSSTIGKRVFFEQIGPRDRARNLGDLGKCGQCKCCKRFLNILPSVTMERARVQNLGSQQLENITGICGKLKCCLNFEADLYRKNLKNLPKMRKKVMIENREGTVCGLDILNKKVKIYFEDTGEIAMVDNEKISPSTKK